MKKIFPIIFGFILIFSPLFANAASMTLAGKKLGTNAWTYLFYLPNPGNGTGTIQLSWSSGSVCWGGISASYNGVANAGPEATSSNALSGVTAISDSVTTITTNDWTIIATRAEAGGTIAGGAATTLRGTGDINESIGDSNSALAAGSHALQITSGNSGNWADVMATMQPASTIAFDNFAKVTAVTTGSSVSWSHKVSGSNTILWVDASTCSSVDPLFTATFTPATSTASKRKVMLIN